MNDSERSDESSAVAKSRVSAYNEASTPAPMVSKIDHEVPQRDEPV